MERWKCPSPGESRGREAAAQRGSGGGDMNEVIRGFSPPTDFLCLRGGKDVNSGYASLVMDIERNMGFLTRCSFNAIGTERVKVR